MLSSIKQRWDREDEGFTLIELMVVVLIIAILLAIAIPTFLGARNSANARSSQSNLHNALTAEQGWWTNNQTFTSDTSTTGLKGVEGSLDWSTAGTITKSDPGNEVAVAVGDNGNAVAMTSYGKDGKCYSILQSDDPANSFTAYYVVDQSSGSCTALAVPSTLPTVTTGPASSNLGGYYSTW